MAKEVEAQPGKDAAGAFNMQDWPFYWLTRFTGRYLQKMELSLKPLGLDIARWRVLMTLHNVEARSVSEIADHALAKLPTMTKVIQRMQADGLVDCRQSNVDGRVTMVTLTETGRDASRKALAIAQGIYLRAFEDVSGGDIATLNRLLRTITRNLAD